MSDLTIDRLTATVTDWPMPEQVPELLRRVADDRLERALREHPLPAGEWCLRRLDVAVALDPDRPPNALESDWADRIVTALRQSLVDGSRDVVRYERPEQAVDDLLAGLALGRHERAWAWRQVGLLGVDDPEPLTDARALFLRVLGRLPHGPVAALGRLVSGVGVAPVHRLLGRDGWVGAARSAAAAVGVGWQPDDGAGLGPTTGRVATGVSREAVTAGASREADPAGVPDPDDPPVEPPHRPLTALAASVATAGPLGRAFRGSGLRVDEPTARAWAVLALAEAGPSLLRRGVATALLPLVAGLLQPAAARGLVVAATGRPRTTAGTPPAPVDATGGAVGWRPGGPTPAGTRHDDRTDRTDRPAPADPAGNAVATPDATAAPSPAGAPTAWGGLLFLLNTASGAGLPEALDEPPFLARPVAWVVRRLGTALVPAASDDPAVLALAGQPEWSPDEPPDAAELHALDACATRWVAATADRLRAGGAGVAGVAEDADLVRRLARREASILQEPGWVEVVLRLDDVDLDVRRAGLDVDPGWVWWLGQVVRFRYE